MERGTIALGNEVKDLITGYQGIVIAICTWFNGCQRITVQAQKLDNGKPIDNQTFDIEQLELIGAGLAPSRKQTGGPCDDRAALRR